MVSYKNTILYVHNNFIFMEYWIIFNCSLVITLYDLNFNYHLNYI